MNFRSIVPALALLVGAFAMPAEALAGPLGVEVWTDRGDDAVYQPGERMTIKVRSSDDAHLLVYEIDTEGRIQVLHPWRRGSGFVEGRHTLRLPPEGSRTELVVERSTGQGFLVAIASRESFRDLPWYLRPYDPQAESVGYDDDERDRDDDEDMTGFDADGKMVGDPYVGMERVRRRVLGRPSDSDDFASSYATYYVHQQVRYPRYVCYDCHSGSRWQWWDGFDPYHTTCSVFDLRVNWSWCWGPCGWTTYVPYYYYVVRSDCPPRYRDWYGQRIRLSSWDDRRRWNDLWGGPLRRIKSDPPAGYQGPRAGGGRTPDVGPGGPRYKPPGYMDSPRPRRDGAALPIGRRTRVGSGEAETREGIKGRPERGPVKPAPREDGERIERPTRDEGRGRRESPRWEPRDKPEEPSKPSREEPRREPSRKPDAPPPKDKPAHDDDPGGKGGSGGGGKGGHGGKGGGGGGGKGRG